MSDAIKHECGIAMIALRKPLDYYVEKYGTAFYGLNKLHLLMQKQHNRGQDGAGIAVIKKNLKPGIEYINRKRSVATNPIVDVFNQVYDHIERKRGSHKKSFENTQWLKDNVKYCGELFLGHLRYGTFGKNEISYQHPFVRSNNWKTRNLAVAGNFNLTNVDELFQRLVDLGQYPTRTSDTVTILEKIGHFLDEENERLYNKYKRAGYSKKQITPLISEQLDLLQVIRESSDNWDGGYVIGGMVGHGDSFLMRDPGGIRPAFYYVNDEVIVAASERPVIQTAFNVKTKDIKELDPGHALIMRNDGSYQLSQFAKSCKKTPCSFERIYFSRGTDSSIYKERKALGAALIPQLLDAIDNDLENTVFSYIPNTAYGAYQGIADGLGVHCDAVRKERLLEEKNLTSEKIDEIFKYKPRLENVAVKDMKLRTFITQDNKRDDLVGHVYDVTYDSIREGKDKLVIVDDSIVRGTTLKQSIIRILDRLNPTKIIVVSSAPQIRYPDCYGIDMAKLGDFIAFRAAIALIKEKNMHDLLNEVYSKCKAQEMLPKDEIVNHVREIYAPFSPEEISGKIAELIKSVEIKADVEVIYQTIENLHDCLQEHSGDWYFTGNYPTPGGNKVVNKAFINFMEGKDQRAY
ncbi:MAG: amidophosphoribosyltransferase [Bacteroidales bacterium]